MMVIRLSRVRSPCIHTSNTWNDRDDCGHTLDTLPLAGFGVRTPCTWLLRLGISNTARPSGDHALCVRMSDTHPLAGLDLVVWVVGILGMVVREGFGMSNIRSWVGCLS